MDAFLLHSIADKLDELNADWDAQVQADSWEHQSAPKRCIELAESISYTDDALYATAFTFAILDQRLDLSSRSSVIAAFNQSIIENSSMAFALGFRDGLWHKYEETQS